MSSPQIMGIVNITDDSFSDGGEFLREEQIATHVSRLKNAGADILDIGVESSNPTGADVSINEQKRRLDRAMPIALAAGLPVSIDSYRVEIVAHALELGAHIVNDISGLCNPEMRALVAGANCDVIPMFNRDFVMPRAQTLDASASKTLASLTPDSIIDTIISYFETMLDLCADAGINNRRIILDPGMGFFLSEDAEVSFQVLRELKELRRFNCRLCVSVSRKSFLGALIEKQNPLERAAATLSCEMYLAEQNVEMIRTHDVGALNDALKVKKHLGI